jgi:hypothetical protein
VKTVIERWFSFRMLNNFNNLISAPGIYLKVNYSTTLNFITRLALYMGSLIESLKFILFLMLSVERDFQM